MAPQSGFTSVPELFHGMPGGCEDVRPPDKERSACAPKNGGQFSPVCWHKDYIYQNAYVSALMLSAAQNENTFCCFGVKKHTEKRGLTLRNLN